MPEPKFTELLVWQKSHGLMLDVFRVSAAFPRNEIFGLTSQIRRSALSVPANIAEGCKKSRIEFRRYLKIAEGSLEETKYYLIVVKDLSYIDQAAFDKLSEQASEVGYLLHRLISSLSQ